MLFVWPLGSHTNNNGGITFFLIAVEPEQVHVFTVILLNQDNKSCPIEDAFKRHTCTHPVCIVHLYCCCIPPLFEYDLMGFFFMCSDCLIHVHIMTRS